MVVNVVPSGRLGDTEEVEVAGNRQSIPVTFTFALAVLNDKATRMV
jgi:hypothetical protein